MSTYAEVKESLDKVAERIQYAITQLRSANRVVYGTVIDLTAIPMDYADIVAFIDAQFAANPDDLNWQFAKGEKDKLVAEFQAQKARAQAIQDAMDAVPD